VAALLTAQQRINAHNPSAQMILAGLPRPLLQRLYDTGLAGRYRFSAEAAALASRWWISVPRASAESINHLQWWGLLKADVHGS
jgi:hypothetical protein